MSKMDLQNKEGELTIMLSGRLDAATAPELPDAVEKESFDSLTVDMEGLEGSVIINKVKESDPGYGFDALTENYVDMVESGILDPAKVTRSALQNATSVASTLLTTESVVANIKEETPAMPAGAGAGMGMM